MAIYNPQDHIVSNKGFGVLGKPVDARGWWTDGIEERPFASREEVLAYFDTPVSREGNFLIYIGSDPYTFKGGTEDEHLLPFAGGLVDPEPVEGSNNAIASDYIYHLEQELRQAAGGISFANGSLYANNIELKLNLDYFAGIWKEGPYQKGWLVVSTDRTKVWKAKQSHTSAAEPVAGVNWELLLDVPKVDAEPTEGSTNGIASGYVQQLMTRLAYFWNNQLQDAAGNPINLSFQTDAAPVQNSTKAVQSGFFFDFHKTLPRYDQTSKQWYDWEGNKILEIDQQPKLNSVYPIASGYLYTQMQQLAYYRGGILVDFLGNAIDLGSIDWTNYYTIEQVNEIIEGLTLEGGSVVLQSAVNGNIRVNGSELKVYTPHPEAYRTIPNGISIIADYALSQNHKHLVEAVTAVTAANLPDGARMAIKFYNPQGRALALSGAGHINLFGEAIASITLGMDAVSTVLVNNVEGELEWTVLGHKSSPFDIDALPALPSALVDTDWFAVNREGAHYKVSGAWIKAFVGSTGGNNPDPTNTAPTILINGANPQYVPQGGSYQDQGAFAADAEDGDLSSVVVATGAVNTATAGTYTVTYTVTDSGGLTASATRQVVVTAQQTVPRLQLSGEGSGIDLSEHMATFNTLTDTVTIEGFFKSYDNKLGSNTENASILLSMQNDLGLGSATSDSFQIGYGNFTNALPSELITIARVNDDTSASGTRSIGGYKVPFSDEYSNTPIHIALVIAPGQLWKLYVNGIQVPLSRPDGQIYSDMVGFLAGMGPMQHLHLGTRYVQGERKNSLNGEMWNWRMWGYARSAEQIQEGMTAEYQAGEPGLKGQWLVRDGSGNIATGTNGLDGIIIGGTWIEVVAENETPVTPTLDDEVISGEVYTGTTLS